MEIPLRGGLILVGPALLVFDNQPRFLAVIEQIFGNSPVEVPDHEWRETVGGWFEMSQHRKAQARARHPLAGWLDEVERRLLHQEALADRFVVAS